MDFETSFQKQIERLGLTADADNPSGIVTIWEDGKVRIADDQDQGVLSGQAIFEALEAIRCLNGENAPDKFWEVISRFEDKEEG